MEKRILHIAAFIVLSMATALSQNITVFNFDGITPAFTGEDVIATIANPATNGINTSANVGQITHTKQYSNVGTVVDVDPHQYTSIEFMVYIPTSITSTVTITLYDAAGLQLDNFDSPVITTAGVWVKISHPITFTRKIAKVEMAFNRNSTPTAVASDNIGYIDNFVFVKSTSPVTTIYMETFYATWSLWAPWTGAPSTQAGKWYGGIDLQTTADGPMTINSWNGTKNDNNLVLSPNAAAVTFTNIDVTGFNSLKLAVDYGWVWSATEPYWSITAAERLPKIEVKSGTGAWITVSTVGLIQDWASNEFVLLDALAAPLAGPIISIRITSFPSITMHVDNVRISGIATSATSVSTVNKSNVSIYPNPATDYISVKGAQSVSIFNLDGKEVLSSQNLERIDVRKLGKGVYVVKAKTGEETLTSKLIKN